MERDRERRLESPDRRRRHLVADRQRRPRLRHVPDRHGDQPRRSAARAGRQCRSHGRAPARRRAHGCARRQDHLPRRGLRPRRRPEALGAAHRRRRHADADPREAQPRDTQPRHRRHARLCALWHGSTGRAQPRRQRRVAASSRQGVLGVRHPVGTRQLPGALRRQPHPALRSPVGVVSRRARQAHRQGKVEGRPGQGPLVLQHAADCRDARTAPN